MDDTDLRLRAMEIAARTNTTDVVAEAERVLARLQGKRRAPAPPSADRLPRAVDLLRAGHSKREAARLAGYGSASALYQAAHRAGVKLPRCPGDRRSEVGAAVLLAYHERRRAVAAAASVAA